ncbi:hypothetical protein FNV43_RR14202 [Rhamnella rubrinervis]|uniref:NAC domain-containing protein n=1 Tax=Rhamnella rubrinervis TaxID=2594499 RepID=A0A8K0H2S9_9ROSA|nr:hypothetical protein FNV43_RR14202 [Rhamnella rubrinervis]
MKLPPGFRFHPTDEELITHYLSPEVLNSQFCTRAIGEADLNKCEPWNFPCRDRKYPTGLRTNRATDAGYWKAKCKDKEIFKAKSLVGMKKTLVFYRGRAPKVSLLEPWVSLEPWTSSEKTTRNDSCWFMEQQFGTFTHSSQVNSLLLSQ